jgi:zinc protease
MPRLRRWLGVLVVMGIPVVTSGTASRGIAAESPSLTDRVREATLENGLKVIVLPITKAPVVTLQVWYRVGSRNEKLGTTGLSHLLEHLMFKETDKLKPEEFSKIIQANGGELNAFTTADYTTYFETLSADRLSLALSLEADRMSNLKLREETTEPEKRVVMEERRLRSVDNPWGALYEETNAAAFRAHPYMWPVIGWMHDIQSATLADIRGHYETYYKPNNAIVVVVGKVDPDDALEEVSKAFGATRPGPPPAPVTEVEPPQLGERRVIVKKEANLPALVWAYKVPNVLNPDSAALEVLATILSEGESSRLYRRLVVEKRLLLDVNADNPLLSLDPNLFTISGQVLPDKKVEEVEAALEREIAAIVADAVTDHELVKAKNQIEAQFVFAQDSNFYQAMLLARFELIGDWRKLDDYLPAVRAVTAEDVRKVARQYLVADHRTVGILVPTGPAKQVAAPPPEMLH